MCAAAAAAVLVLVVLVVHILYTALPADRYDHETLSHNGYSSHAFVKLMTVLCSVL